MPTPKLTPELIAAAVEGYVAQKTRIDQKIAELRALLDGSIRPTATTPEATKRKRRKMSAAGRKAIAEAQRKRWIVAKKATEPAPQEPATVRRKLSAAGRKRIIAATKKRWAAVRAAKAQQEKTAVKKTATKKAKQTAAAAPVAGRTNGD